MRFGMHLSISPRFTSAAERAAALGCNCLQIFSGNPRGWAKTPIDPSEAEAFRAAVKSLGLWPVVVHSTYLINPASPSRALWRRSVRAMADELERCRMLGAEHYVLHPGHHLGSGAKAGLRRLGEALDEALGASRRRGGAQVGTRRMQVLLENTAGGGSSLGGSFRELARVLDAMRKPESVGLCLDTAHAFAHGYAVHTPDGLRQTLDEIDDALGVERLRVVHANDTKADFGSHLDRHDHVGSGKLGREGLRNILACETLRDLPMILETPVDRKGDEQRDLRALKALARRRDGAETRRGG
jgi:deoxyribonuclease-4